MNNKIEILLEEMRGLQNEHDIDMVHYQADQIMGDLVENFSISYGQEDKAEEILEIYKVLDSFHI